MLNYQSILFDLDGTVTDPKTGITKSVAYALKHFGRNVENLDSLTKFIGPPLKDSFMRYFGFSESEADLAIAKYREYFAHKGIFENLVYSGMEDFLKALKRRNRTLILATSKPAVYAEKILEHFHLSRYFSFVSGSELNGARTDKGEVIAYALARNSIGKHTAVMIGDRAYDILGAKENGIASVGVLYGYGSPQEIESAGADYTAGSVKDLTSLFVR